MNIHTNTCNNTIFNTSTDKNNYKKHEFMDQEAADAQLWTLIITQDRRRRM